MICPDGTFSWISGEKKAVEEVANLIESENIKLLRSVYVLVLVFCRRAISR